MAPSLARLLSPRRCAAASLTHSMTRSKRPTVTSEWDSWFNRLHWTCLIWLSSLTLFKILKSSKIKNLHITFYLSRAVPVWGQIRLIGLTKIFSLFAIKGKQCTKTFCSTSKLNKFYWEQFALVNYRMICRFSAVKFQTTNSSLSWFDSLQPYTTIWDR